MEMESGVEWFVLSHGVHNVPVKVNEEDLSPAQYEVFKGAGIDDEMFEKVVKDEEIKMRIRMFCEEYDCNQVVISRDGFPEGFISPIGTAFSF